MTKRWWQRPISQALLTIGYLLASGGYVLGLNLSSGLRWGLLLMLVLIGGTGLVCRAEWPLLWQSATNRPFRELGLYLVWDAGVLLSDVFLAATVTGWRWWGWFGCELVVLFVAISVPFLVGQHLRRRQPPQGQ